MYLAKQREEETMANKEKKNGITVIDKTEEVVESEVSVASPDEAKAVLEALTDEQRAELLKDMGFTQKKAAKKKDEGPTPKELFNAAAEKLGEQAPAICTALTEFPGAVAVTFAVDPDGVFSANVKRVRNKYGPRKSKNS